MKCIFALALAALCACSGSSNSSGSTSTGGSSGGSGGTTGATALSVTGPLATAYGSARQIFPSLLDGGTDFNADGGPNLAVPAFVATELPSTSSCGALDGGGSANVTLTAGYLFQGNESIDVIGDLPTGSYPIFPPNGGDGSGGFVTVNREYPDGGSDGFQAWTGAVAFTLISGRELVGSFDVGMLDAQMNDAGRLQGSFDVPGCLP